jgi:hypothetical protein
MKDLIKIQTNYSLAEKLKKENLKNLETDGSFVLALSPIALSLIIGSAILILNPHLPPTLPLFYSLPWGELQLAKTYQLLIIPATFLCISLANLIIFLQLNNEMRAFKRILSLTSIITSLILSISFLQVISIFI